MAQVDELAKKVDEVEAKNKEVIDRNINVSVTEKQANILRKIIKEKAELEVRFTKLGEQEQDFITIIAEFKNINQEKVEQVKFSELGDSLIFTMKPESKPESKPEVLKEVTKEEPVKEAKEVKLEK